MTSEELADKLVRWEHDGQWLTARIAGTGTFRDSFRGEVVDPGNYTGLNSDIFGPQQVQAGTWLPNLARDLITVIDDVPGGHVLVWREAGAEDPGVQHANSVHHVAPKAT